MEEWEGMKVKENSMLQNRAADWYQFLGQDDNLIRTVRTKALSPEERYQHWTDDGRHTTRGWTDYSVCLVEWYFVLRRDAIKNELDPSIQLVGIPLVVRLNCWALVVVVTKAPLQKLRNQPSNGEHIYYSLCVCVFLCPKKTVWIAEKKMMDQQRVPKKRRRCQERGCRR